MFSREKLIIFLGIFLASFFLFQKDVRAQAVCSGSNSQSSRCDCKQGIDLLWSCVTSPVTNACGWKPTALNSGCAADQVSCNDCQVSPDGTSCQASQIFNGYSTQGCFVTNPTAPPTPTPTPAPGGCSSTWCTTQGQCAAVGGTWSSGAGFCAGSDVRCCPPGGGGGYTPNCAWDTFAVGYPRCNFGEGNACPDQFCNPPFGTCNNCAPGLVNINGTCLCPPTCNISLNPNPGTVLGGGGTTTFTAGTDKDPVVSSVTFSSSNTGVATVTTPDTTSPFTTTATGLNKGSATITATAMISGIAACSATATANVTDPGPWWQVKDGDVVTNGRIISSIPSTCAAPGCTPRFNLDGAGGYPGLVVSGSISPSIFSSPGGSGTVSSKGWLANTSYLGKTYGYSFFEGLISSTVTVNEIATDTIDANYFQVNGTPQNSFVWFRRTGNLTITGNVNVNSNRKVILLVKGGDLTEAAQIRLNRIGDGFFMAIVNGNINFDANLARAGGQPAVEGLFLADGTIRTGAGSEQLYVRGTLAALGGVALERNLGVNNANTPGELIEYAPDLIFSYPRELTRTRVVWREVAP